MSGWLWADAYYIYPPPAWKCGLFCHLTSEASIFNGLKAFLYFTLLLAKVVKVAWLLGFNVLVSILLDQIYMIFIKYRMSVDIIINMYKKKMDIIIDKYIRGLLT